MSTGKTTPPADEQSWVRQHSTALWAAAGAALLVLALVVSMAIGDDSSRPPTSLDGEDCVSASSSEIRSWVASHKAQIPAGLSLRAVTREVEKECEDGLAIFNDVLLSSAVTTVAPTVLSVTDSAGNPLSSYSDPSLAHIATDLETDGVPAGQGVPGLDVEIENAKGKLAPGTGPAVVTSPRNIAALKTTIDPTAEKAAISAVQAKPGK